MLCTLTICDRVVGGHPCTNIWPGFDEYDIIDGGLQRSDTESSLLTVPPILLTAEKSVGSKIRQLKPCRRLAPRPTYLPRVPTSRRLCSTLAFVVVFACPSGPKTHTALSAARSWTSGDTAPWRAVVAGTETLVTMQLGTSSFQPLDARVEPGSCSGKIRSTEYVVIPSMRTVLPILARLTPLAPPVVRPTSGFPGPHWRPGSMGFFPSAALFTWVPFKLIRRMLLAFSPQ